MKISLPYGNKGIKIDVPDERLAGILRIREAPSGRKDPVKSALERPVNAPTFGEFVEKSRDILIIVNDGTRPTPTAEVLRHILPFLRDKLQSGKVSVLIATGTHRAPTEEEFRFIFGQHLSAFKGHIHSHDSLHDPMTDYGTTIRKTRVLINSLLEEADGIVTINSVEPHYFAGYTGGRKSIVPGAAGFETIEHNHSFALSGDAQALRLKGNPVHEDLEEALGLFLETGKRVFSIQMVLDRHHRIYEASAGNIMNSFYEAAGYAEEVFSVPIREKADIVITAASPPMDLNLYQAQKALEHGRLALKKRGIIILVSECRNGVGNNTFLRLMEEGGSPERVMEIVRENYRLGYHKSARLSALARESEVWAYTSLDDSILRGAFMRPVHNLQNAVEEAMKRMPEGEVAVIPEGSITVPVATARH